MDVDYKILNYDTWGEVKGMENFTIEYYVTSDKYLSKVLASQTFESNLFDQRDIYE